mmetsp:Transcript_41443/g.130266  ORF Transcript_41443/g.130266 Transcript_41443/m.130266 type:complete len:217 (+) Transcript_41443:960-1610(+)
MLRRRSSGSSLMPYTSSTDGAARSGGGSGGSSGAATTRTASPCARSLARDSLGGARSLAHPASHVSASGTPEGSRTPLHDSATRPASRPCSLAASAQRSSVVAPASSSTSNTTPLKERGTRTGGGAANSSHRRRNCSSKLGAASRVAPSSTAYRVGRTLLSRAASSAASLASHAALADASDGACSAWAARKMNIGAAATCTRADVQGCPRPPLSCQ